MRLVHQSSVALLGAVLLAQMASSCLAVAQDAVSSVKVDASTPAFAVISVKENKTDNTFTSDLPSEGITIKSAPLLMIIKLAYASGGTRDSQIVGLPAWAKLAKFDIATKVDDADMAAWNKLSLKQRWGALQGVLEERFKLKLHQEIKELPSYALVVAKEGPRLKQAEAGNAYADGIKNGDGTVLGAGYSQASSCMLRGQAISMKTLANFLTSEVDRNIVDRTGLPGAYDIDLKYRTEKNGLLVYDNPGEAPTHRECDAPTLFDALRQQLGLRLESQKISVPMYVIDHVDLPTEN